MKKYLQLRSNHILVKCILSIVILSLIFTTMNSYTKNNSEKYIATVNGEKISLSTFQQIYFLEQEKQKKILGKNFFKFRDNKQFIQKTYDYILSQLINNVLWEQYVKKMKLQVNDSDIKKIIVNYPLFQKNKIFNKELYLNYLASVNLTNDEYINKIKTKINTENLIHTIIQNNFILKNEQNNFIKLLSQKRIIKTSTMKIDSMLQKQNVSIKEVKNFFYKNRNNFYIPEKFQINFVELNPNYFKTICNDKEIHDFYLKNTQKYLTKEKKKYSIIQTKTKAEALLITSELSHAPETFAKLAREKSIDPISSKKGGDIGWLSNDMIPNAIKQANLTKINQISDVIPFHHQFLIIKLNTILPARQKKLHEVYDIIKKEIQHTKSLNLYNNFVNKVSKIIQNNPKKAQEILKKNHISIQETNWFDENLIPKNLNNPILKNIIFHKKLLQKNDTPKSYFHFIIFKNKKSFFIKLKAFQKKKIQSFQNVKKSIQYQLQLIKAIKNTKEIAEKITNELNQGKNTLFQKSHLYFSKPEIISRYDHNPIASIIFSLPRIKHGKKQYVLYQDQNKNCIIISLEKVYNTNISPREKNIILKYLEENNTEMIFNAILKNLREKSIITYNKIEYKQ